MVRRDDIGWRRTWQVERAFGCWMWMEWRRWSALLIKLVIFRPRGGEGVIFPAYKEMFWWKDSQPEQREPSGIQIDAILPLWSSSTIVMNLPLPLESTKAPKRGARTCYTTLVSLSTEAARQRLVFKSTTAGGNAKGKWSTPDEAYARWSEHMNSAVWRFPSEHTNPGFGVFRHFKTFTFDEGTCWYGRFVPSSSVPDNLESVAGDLRYRLVHLGSASVPSNSHIPSNGLVSYYFCMMCVC